MKKINLHLMGLVLFLMTISLSAQEVITGENVAITNTESGKVRGYIHNGTYIYKGIPYAKAERFMSPTKADSWEGVRSSTMYVYNLISMELQY